MHLRLQVQEVSTMTSPIKWRGLVMAAGCVAALVAGGCKSSDNSDKKASPAAPPAHDQAGSAAGSAAGNAAAAAAEGDPKILAYATDLVTRGYANRDRELPTTAPKPQPGKNVWIISPGQIGESASIPTNAAKAAGETIGWKMTIFDSKLDPSQFSAGIRQAIAAKADGIILDAIDCAFVRQALAEAREAKIKTIAFYAFDCDDPAIKGQPLFDGMVAFDRELTNYADLTRAWGALKADWVIAQTKAKAKVIAFKEDELLVVKYIREGFEQELAKCTTCELVKTVDFTLADLGPKLQQKAEAALLQHPEANAIHVPYDSAVILGVAAAVFGSGRNDQLAVVGGEGFPSNLELIRANRGQDAANAFPSQWTGWASIDALNRVFHGEKVVDSGISFRLIDRDHNLPAPGKGYQPDVDYRAALAKAWGVTLK
jgi:ribose transport system substrate-binding protein